jgi:hypothetical protein
MMKAKCPKCDHEFYVDRHHTTAKMGAVLGAVSGAAARGRVGGALVGGLVGYLLGHLFADGVLPTCPECKSTVEPTEEPA